MTYRDHTVGVVIPAYNEEGFIGDVVEGIPTYVDRIYPVDDCSTDDTWDEITAVAERENERRAPTVHSEEVVVPIRHDRNQGAGAATLTGYRRALDDDVDLVARMDGDGQMDPVMLSHLLDPLVDEEVSYAKGDRLAGLDYVSQMSRWRLFGNVLLTALTRVSSGYWRLRDPQNGYTAITHEALDSLSFDDLFDHYGFCNDVLIHLNADGYDVADVAHPAVYGDEESTIQYSSFIPRLSGLLFSRWQWRLQHQTNRPVGAIALGSFLGSRRAVSVGVGHLLQCGTNGSSDSLETDGGRRTRQERPGVSQSVRLLLVGCLSLVVGVLADSSSEHGCVVRKGSADADESDPTGAL